MGVSTAAYPCSQLLEGYGELRQASPNDFLLENDRWDIRRCLPAKLICTWMCALCCTLCVQSVMGENGHRENGWKWAQFFVGNESLTRNSEKLWYGQVGQDRIIQEKILLGKKSGYFVDLAANDPVSLSNTYALEKFYSWEGICVEVNPIYIWRLALRNCSFVGAVVGSDVSKLVTFHMPFDKNEGGHGGIVSRV